MKKILSLLAVLFLATACIYPYQPDLEDAPEGVLVVDGSIVLGEMSTVYVGSMSSLWPDPDGVRSKIPVKRVWAEDDAGDVYDGTITAVDQIGYLFPMTKYVLRTENAPSDRSYRVCVNTDDALYTSDWIRPLAPPVIKKITFKSDKTDVRVYVTLEGGKDATGYMLLSFDETWRFHTDYFLDFDYDPETNTVSEFRIKYWDRYWCFRSLDQGLQIPVDYTGMTTSGVKDFPLHSFSRYDNRNHHRYSILVKARTIDKHTYKFLQHLEESTGAGDNLFTPNPGEIQGNLRCETEPDRMVLGYVTVSTSSTLRAYIGSQYLLTKARDNDALSYPLQSGNMAGENGWRDFYSRGYMPLVPNTHINYNPEMEGPYGWGAARCYDCFAAGGTQDIPDFWEE